MWLITLAVAEDEESEGAQVLAETSGGVGLNGIKRPCAKLWLCR